MPRPTSHIQLESLQIDGATGASSSFEPVTVPAHGQLVGGTISGPQQGVGDAESQSCTMGKTSADHDPFNLRAAYKTDLDLEQIKVKTSHKRRSSFLPPPRHSFSNYQGGGAKDVLERCLPSVASCALKAARIAGFYESQNATIKRFLTSVEEHRAAARVTKGDDALRFKIAVWGSFVANVLLAILQLYAAISSGSLSLFATMADSIFDPLSNLTLILASRAVGRVDPSRFPSGKARLETVGNIVFCFLMVAVSVMIIAFSAQDLSKAEPRAHGVNEFHLSSLLAVCSAFATKLALFMYCWTLRNKYSQVRILWQDHRNDLFVNGFGILTSVSGASLVWWMDPVGAIAISVVVSAIWLRTAFKEFILLVGVVASVEKQQLITYVCLTHEPLVVKGIDTVRVYHSGPRLIAEIDIVMDMNKSLRETHDVAEALQVKLESLPDIERAYVHVDYETTHKPEHYWKKDL